MLTGVVQIPAQAALSSPVDLLTQANITLDGAAAYDYSGRSVAGAGDVNGDGIADVIIGAPDANSSYVVYGNATPTSPVQLGALDPASTGFRIDGAAGGDRSGSSVAGAGDINGDGIADVIIGAPNADNNSRTNSGSSYVVYGSDTPTNINLNSLGTAGFRIDGAATSDNSGNSVAGAGDVNGDDKDDVIIGAPNADPNGNNSGSSYVVYGSDTPTDIDLNSLDAAGFRIDGAAANDSSGRSVAGAGDVNGDDKDDVIIGAPFADPNGEASGSSYVVYGNATPTSPVQLGSLNPASTGFRIDGALADDRSGSSVAGAGDVNGDDKDDVIIGAPNADNNSRSNSGSSYVVYGSATPTDIDLLNSLGAAGFRIDGAGTNDGSGNSVAGARDVNGDGKDDVIIGAPRADNNSRSNSGSSYVVYGSATPTDIDLATPLDPASTGFRIDGAAAGAESGSSVAGAGDVNGDGTADVIIGAPYADNNSRNDSGSSYVVYGPVTAGPLTFTSGDFGSTPVGVASPLDVTVTNTGGAATPSAITPTGDGVTVTGGTCAAATPIPVAGTCTVALSWTPTAPGSLAGANLTVAYPGGGAASNTLALTGTATTPVGPLTFTSGDFGSTSVGVASPLDVTVTNTGDGAATPSAITPTGDGVTVTGGTCAAATSIPVAGTCTVALSWTPTAPGSLTSADLTVAYPGGVAASNTLALSGTATTTAGPLTFTSGDFGSTSVGVASPLEVTVTNTGNGDATPSAITPTGDGVTVTGGTCAAATSIPVAGTCTVALSWTPTAPGSLAGADLTVAYPGGASASDSLTLAGTGTDTPVPPADKLPQSQKTISTALPVKGKKVVNTKNAQTKQGRKMTAKVTRVSSKGITTRGDIACYKVKKGPKRKLVIKTNGQCGNIKIWVTYKAPGNATYEKYRNTVTFKTKR